MHVNRLQPQIRRSTMNESRFQANSHISDGEDVNNDKNNVINPSVLDHGHRKSTHLLINSTGESRVESEMINEEIQL